MDAGSGGSFASRGFFAAAGGSAPAAGSAPARTAVSAWMCETWKQSSVAQLATPEATSAVLSPSPAVGASSTGSRWNPRNSTPCGNRECPFARWLSAHVPHAATNPIRNSSAAWKRWWKWRGKTALSRITGSRCSSGSSAGRRVCGWCCSTCSWCQSSEGNRKARSKVWKRRRRSQLPLPRARPRRPCTSSCPMPVRITRL
mmetsp:Transcript_52669/g.141025  ORF Transcript_52669/g.141025 Transcript_52669/m.141025 type:complete len:201 (-) Transcript_52669:132-734(-)